MERGLFRHVAYVPGDLEECIVATYLQRTANDIGAVEIAAGGAFIDHDGVRVVELKPLIYNKLNDWNRLSIAAKMEAWELLQT